MKLKCILIKGIFAFQFWYLNINHSKIENYIEKDIENYFDLAEIEDNTNPDSVKITKQQIENIKKAYFNKTNSNIKKMPISVFFSIFTQTNKNLDITPWYDLITAIKKDTRTILLKENADLENINNHRIIDIFIISTLFIESDISANQNIDKSTKEFLINIYNNISEEQKKVLVDSIKKAHKKIFRASFCFNYPHKKEN